LQAQSNIGFFRYAFFPILNPEKEKLSCLHQNQAKMNRLLTRSFFGGGALLLLYFFYNGNFFNAELTESETNNLSLQEASIIEPQTIYGFAQDAFHIVEGTIKRNQNLSQILTAYNVNYSIIDQVARKSKEVFDVRKLAADKKFTLLCDKDSLTPKYFIYEPNKTEYVVYELDGDLNIVHETKDVVTELKGISGIVSSSVYDAMIANGGTDKLVDEFADIYGWKIDFLGIQKGDYFKVIYEEKSVDGEVIGIGKIIAAEMNHWNKPLFALGFDQGDGVDYFDHEGNSLKRAFLRYPVNFTRISSRYTANRLHPVTKTYKAHLGTDFAAPTGTPIRAAADGTIIESGYSSGNGNYVKIKHNGTYTTGYLHMSKIDGSAKKGSRVRQGQVIGYVGSTGLATGPHLCYRFWKNGVQVDALKVELPPEKPIEASNKGRFESEKNILLQQLMQIPVQSKEVMVAIL
jgi:murein DD-endopeptidase MepM/ murein hydrolase activator NlpD